MQKDPIKIPREPVLPKQPEPEPVPEMQREPEPEPEPVIESTDVQYTHEEPQQIAQTQHLVSHQPDVIPTQRESVQSDKFEPLAPPEAFSGNENDIVTENVPELVQSVPYQAAIANEQIYSNINYIQENSQANTDEVNQPSTLAGNENYDLAEYIEDTKIQAIALYDYQSSAEDEISFDPNDLITHIEKVLTLKQIWSLI